MTTSSLILLVSSSHFTGRREESTIVTVAVAAAPKLNLGDVTRRRHPVKLTVHMSHKTSLQSKRDRSRDGKNNRENAE